MNGQENLYTDVHISTNQTQPYSPNHITSKCEVNIIWETNIFMNEADRIKLAIHELNKRLTQIKHP